MPHILDFMQRIDTSLFFFINDDLANPFLDWLMPMITTQQNWYPFFLIIIGMLLWKGGRQGRIVVLLLIPLIVLSDQISSSILKPLFDRVRPCQAFEALGRVNMLIGLKTSPSFPSSHAANSFAAAAFFAHFYPRR
ncbi:phosphatase PAP2 family protein, partial [candidate division KSB1 bacterium]